MIRRAAEAYRERQPVEIQRRRQRAPEGQEYDIHGNIISDNDDSATNSDISDDDGSANTLSEPVGTFSRGDSQHSAEEPGDSAFSLGDPQHIAEGPRDVASNPGEPRPARHPLGQEVPTHEDQTIWCKFR